MAATIYIEQDRGTFSGTLHRYNGYNACFSTPCSETPQVGQRTDRPARRHGRDYTRNGW